MRHLFYDCGFNRGIYLELLLNLNPKADRKNMGLPPDVLERDNSDFEYHAFEPNPEILKYPKESLDMENPGLKFNMHNKLVSVVDGDTQDMLLCGKKAVGSTVYFEQPDSKNRKTIKVESIDFANFLKSTATESDRVIVKLDIEGSEYAVLARLIDTGAIYLIDDLICEFHKKGTTALDREDYKIVYQYFKEGYKKHLNSLTAWRLRHLCWAANEKRIEKNINYIK